MKISRTPRTVFVAGLAVAILALAGCGEEEAPEAEIVRPVKAILVGDIDAFRQRWLPGRAKAVKEAELSFRVSGTVTSLPVKVGGHVNQGDLVAQIDPATYQAEVDRTQANLSRTNATLSNASLELDRNKKLFDKGHVAQARVDQV
ncbi:MAG: biotin/lipoyl-binding protein [Alphaproteobacteria bacterium]|nr:biotin/lipoyl-binding protein [Alphaproteobacteria bacterium]